MEYRDSGVTELGIDAGDLTVDCPIKGRITVYKCVGFFHTGVCRLEDKTKGGREIRYKLPIGSPSGDGLYYGFYDLWPVCKNYAGVSVDKHDVILSVFCHGPENSSF
jgi:hypothetical protein